MITKHIILNIINLHGISSLTTPAISSILICHLTTLQILNDELLKISHIKIIASYCIVLCIHFSSVYLANSLTWPNLFWKLIEALLRPLLESCFFIRNFRKWYVGGWVITTLSIMHIRRFKNLKNYNGQIQVAKMDVGTD